MTKHYSLRITLTLMISVFCSGLLFAQSQFTPYDDIPGIIKSYKPSYEDSYPEWAKMLYKDQINFNEIEKGFQTYMDSHSGEKSPIIRYYKIWRRAVESYTLEDGTIQILHVCRYQAH